MLNALHLETIENLYKQHFNSLHRLAQKMHCHDVANDIVQDVFTDYYQKTQMGKEIKYPKSFLYRSSLNKCIDEFRKSRKFANIEPPENTEDGRQNYEKKEERTLVSQSMVMLNNRDRELAVLYSEGLSYKEISEITGIPFASVGKTLARALTKLEKELKTNGYEMY
jgi:RNA polymerase sigma-70 factor, ECF subfamily